MTAKIMDGKAIGAAIRSEVAEGAAALAAKGLRAPGLAAVLGIFVKNVVASLAQGRPSRALPGLARAREPRLGPVRRR